MNAGNPKPSNEEFTELFIANEEALMTGDAAGASLFDSSSTPGLDDRLHRNLECVQLLRQVLGPKPETNLPWENLGRFELRRELGRGGFGIVYLAYDPHLNREVALKVPRAEMALSTDLRERFHREAQAAAALDHPNLVQIYEAGEIGPVCFIVSAYCPGITLSHWLKEQSAPIDFNAAAAFMATIGGAVDHAHNRGVIHRDLKPGNILLSSRLPDTGRADDHSSTIDENETTRRADSCQLTAGAYVPKITDFGLAKLIQHGVAEGQTRSGAIVGTVNYMAPEQASGKAKEVGPAADVYSLGAMLYEMITGRPPFRGESDLDTLQQVRNAEPVSPRRLRPKLPRDLETITLKCLEKEPAKRYASAAALAGDLQCYLEARPISARPLNRREKLWRWCRRQPALATAAALGAALVLVTVGLSIGWAATQSQTLGELKLANKDIADKAKLLKEETTQLQTKTDAWRKALVMAAHLTKERGLNLCTQGHCGEGLLWLTRGLQIAPEDEEDLQWSIRSQIGAWSHQAHRLINYREYPGYVCGLAFTPDNRSVVVVQSKERQQIQAYIDGKPHDVTLSFATDITLLALSPDGRLGAIKTDDKSIQVWNVVTGEAVTPRLSHASPPADAKFCRDGKTIMTYEQHRKVRFWRLANGEPLGPPLPHWETNHDNVALSVDGKFAVTSSFDRLTVWEVSRAKALHMLRFDHSAIRALSPDGKQVVVDPNKQAVHLWDFGADAPSSRLLPHYMERAWSAAYSRDGSIFVTLGVRQLRFWNAKTGNAIGPTIPLSNDFVYSRHLRVSPNGKILAAFGRGIQLWDMAERRPLGQPLHPSQSIKSLAISPDGKSILVQMPIRNAVSHWRISNGLQIGPLLPRDGSVLAVSSSKKENAILALSYRQAQTRNMVRAWDFAGRERFSRLISHGSIKDAAFGPDGEKLVVADKIAGLQLWDMKSGKQIGPSTKLPSGLVSTLEFHPEGKTIVLGIVDRARGEIRFWSATTGLQLGPAISHPHQVFAVKFSSDGSKFVVASGHQLQLWDTGKRQPLGQPIAVGRNVRTIALSPCGKYLLTGSGSIVRLWSVSTGKPLGKPLLSSTRPNQGAAFFTPDGKLIVTCTDSTARLWQAASRKQIGPDMVHPLFISASFMNPDGTSFLTGSGDGMVRRWRVPKPKEGTADQLVLWAQLATGLELEPDGALRQLDAAAWQKRHRQFQKLGAFD